MGRMEGNWSRRRGEGVRAIGERASSELEVLKDCIAWRWEGYVKICIA